MCTTTGYTRPISQLLGTLAVIWILCTQSLGMPAMILILGAKPLGTQSLLPWVQGSWVCQYLTQLLITLTKEKINVLTGQPLHPIKHALQIFTDASIEGWGAHLDEHTARGTWSLLGSKLHINYLELKAVFLALKEFQDPCPNKKYL